MLSIRNEIPNRFSHLSQSSYLMSIGTTTQNTACGAFTNSRTLTAPLDILGTNPQDGRKELLIFAYHQWRPPVPPTSLILLILQFNVHPHKIFDETSHTDVYGSFLRILRAFFFVRGLRSKLHVTKANVFLVLSFVSIQCIFLFSSALLPFIFEGRLKKWGYNNDT